MPFCDNNQQTASTHRWQDPLGPTAMGPGGGSKFSPTGAPQLRSRIFDYLGSYLPQAEAAGNEFAGALKTAAGNPAWKQANDFATQTLAGRYLNGSPSLDRALAQNRASSLAEAANETARIKSGFAKNGMNFSTAAQQADQSAQAAATARANALNAQAYQQNYLAERANQNNAPGMLQLSTSAPLAYLSQVSGASTAPLSQIGNLVSGLSSGGQVFQTGGTMRDTPSMGSNILNGLGGL